MGLIGTVSLIAAHPLNRGRRMAGIARYIGWQIGARLVPGPVAVEFVNGALLLARPGLTGATGNVYVGLHEFNDMAFVLHLLRPGDLFVDAGANIGSYTVLAAAAVGARCMAFEPDPAAFGWLMKNVGLNGVGSRIEARCEALGSAAGTLAFTVGLDAVNHVVAGGAEAPVATTRTVPVTTLDAALAGRIPMMIKIDVEGYETEVIAGAAATLDHPSLRAVLVELLGAGDRYGFDESRLRQRMAHSGFEECSYSPLSRRLSPRTREAGNNVLFVRDRRFVEERLAEAPPFTVLGKTV